MLVIAFAAAQENGVDLNPFRPEFGLFVWVTISFLVVLYLLAKRVFPRLEETLADRERRIKADLEKAEQTQQQAERLLEDYKSRLAQAREESNRIIEEARQSAEQVRRDLIAKSENEARNIFERAQRELAGERERAVSELQQQLAAWSAEIASRIIEREIDADVHRKLVEAFIRDVQNEGRKRS